MALVVFSIVTPDVKSPANRTKLRDLRRVAFYLVFYNGTDGDQLAHKGNHIFFSSFLVHRIMIHHCLRQGRNRLLLLQLLLKEQ